MSTTLRPDHDLHPGPEPVLAGTPPRGRPTPPREGESRGITSSYERRQPVVRALRGLVNVGLLVFLVVVALGPILWLAKSAITPTQDTLRDPLALWPHGMDWELSLIHI